MRNYVVLTAILASVLQLMRGAKTFAIPPAAEWAVACVAVVWVAVPLVAAIISGKVSLGLGALLGLFSAGMPLAMLIWPTKPELFTD